MNSWWRGGAQLRHDFCCGVRHAGEANTLGPSPHADQEVALGVDNHAQNITRPQRLDVTTVWCNQQRAHRANVQGAQLRDFPGVCFGGRRRSGLCILVVCIFSPHFNVYWLLAAWQNTRAATQYVCI